MKNVWKNNSGITVLSLIITIIVLLILVGVTINSTIGNGSILHNAGKVVEHYDAVVPDEEKNLDSIKDYFNEKVDQYGK